MKRSLNSIVIGAIFLLFLGSLILPLNENVNNIQKGIHHSEEKSLLSLTPSDPITITSNNDFASLGFPGNGSESNPYRIEDLEFSSSDTSISIRNTNVSFIISGCSFTGGSQNQGRAISLEYVSNGTVDACFATYIQFGVRVEYSDNISIVNNDYDTVGYGIFCAYSNNLTLSWNTVLDARDEGIGTYFCDDCIIHGNSVINGGETGLWLYETYNTFVTNNTVSHCGYRAMILDWYYSSGYGINAGNCFNDTFLGNSVTDSRDVGMISFGGNNHTFVQNYFSNNGPWGDIRYGGNYGTFKNNTFEKGIIMDSSTGNTMEGNTVGGRPVGYLYQLDSVSINISDYGQVFIDNCNNIEVYSGSFTDSVVGINVHQSVSCLVNDVEISNAWNGIQLRYSNDCIINATRVSDSIQHGLYNEQSSGTSIFYSNFTGSGRSGIRLASASNCNITLNRFVNNNEGGVWFDGSNTYLKNNTFYGDGLIDLTGNIQIVIDNTVNDKPLGYFYNEIGGGIANTEFGQLLIVACNGFAIDNCNVTDISTGILIVESTDCTVQNSNSSYNSIRGVWDFFSSGTMISNCIIAGNGEVGIEISETEYTTITGNMIIENQGNGIDIWASDYLTLEDNQIIGNWAHGFICDWPQTWTVSRNNISYNGDDGVVLWHGWNVVVQNNTVVNNNGDGFFLDESEYCTFTGNWIEENSGYAFYLNSQCGSNTFYDNIIGQSCRDDGTNDQWDNGSNLGNRWDDYGGVGYYYVPGSGGGIDHYPRVLDFDDPIISSPLDFIMEQASTGNYILWTVTDKTPDSYEVYLNESIYESSDSIISEVNINIDGLGLGAHNFTLVVYDLVGNHASDTVIVFVEDTLPPAINNPDDIYYVLEEVGHTISWQYTDPNPEEYTIFKNGTVVKSGLLNLTSDMISIDVDGLEIGIYNYTIKMSDSFGNNITDTVFVVVTEYPITSVTDTTSTSGSTNTTSSTTEGFDLIGSFTLILTIGSLSIIIVVAVLIYKNK